LFTAITTRLDIIFVTLRLTRFLINLSKEYYVATNRVLLYLNKIKSLALKLRKGDYLKVVSNVLFTDNTLNRKSF
jgi:hypothetical protein